MLAANNIVIVYRYKFWSNIVHIGLMINYHMQESIIEENENEDDSDSELDDGSVDSDRRNTMLSPGMKMVKDEDIEPKAPLSNHKSKIHSPDIFSPLDSPKAGPNSSSTNPDTNNKREPKYLRLLSTRLRDSTTSDSLSSSSLEMSTDHMFNSDKEIRVYTRILNFPCYLVLVCSNM